MLSLAECMGFSDLSEDELAVIAEHQNVPLIVAAEIGYALLQTPRGVYTLRCQIQDVLEQAKLSGRQAKAKRLERVLARFNAAHPTPRLL